MTRLSIITVNYRCWDHLERFLDAFGGTGCEIVVVDNDSDDGRLDAFSRRYPDVRFVANEDNHGFAHGCNLGAKVAGGELLLFLNPDVVAAPSQLDRLVREKDRYPDVAVLTTRQVDERGRPQKVFDSFPGLAGSFSVIRSLRRRLAPARYPDPRAGHRGRVNCDWVSGSLLLISAEDFRALGGWSDAYWMYMEDVDLCRRARARGMVVAYTPEAEFRHAHGGSSRRDSETEALARSETVISKHVYASRHFGGGVRVAFHALLAARTLLGLGLATPVHVLTLGRSRALAVRTQMLRRLLVYYGTALRSGSWLSPRSIRSRVTAA